jgi:FlaA1/EpsC-like NDP-sugar epimerase
MGEEVRILELATKMIRFRGLRVGRDVEIQFTGLRPGEKMREQLFTADESTAGTRHPSILKITSPPLLDRAELIPLVDDLLFLARDGQVDALRAHLWATVQKASRAPEPAGLAPGPRAPAGASGDAREPVS